MIEPRLAGETSELGLPVVESDYPIASVSIVIPVFNEVDSIPLLYDEIVAAVEPLELPWELIFVDDGSTDGTTRTLHNVFARDPRVQIIEFRRNFGKSAALAAGFEAADGDAIVTMDGDLQDLPAEIPRLIEQLNQGADLVSGWKFPRHDPLSKRLPSTLFNSVVRSLSGIKLHDFNCGLKAYRREVIKEIRIYGELHRYIPVLAHFRGFRVVEIQVDHRARKYGRSKFGNGRFARGFFDLLTVLFLAQYTRRPLHFFGWFGVGALMLGLVINAYLATIWFLGHAIGTRPLLTLGVLLMIIGAQFVVFGLLAEMIASTKTERDYSVRRTLVRWRLDPSDHSDEMR
ncbi:MAG TPA: glycosyltransferase family 2 protein [Nitrolancea sp.]|nr:glycosyltransferase family 2 protein [Nitrolancea sp.]